MTVVTANPGMPLISPSESPQNLLGHKANVTLKTLLTQNSAVAATVKTRPLCRASQPVAWPTCRGGMWPSQWGSLCVRPGSKPAKACPMPTSRAWRCACQALGGGSSPASPWLTLPEISVPGRNVTGLPERPGASGEAAKLRTSSKHRVNTSFQREVVARGQTVPQAHSP